jgi:hypothetical protein
MPRLSACAYPTEWGHVQVVSPAEAHWYYLARDLRRAPVIRDSGPLDLEHAIDLACGIERGLD